MIRSAFGIKKLKVGHAGTLDPLASGLLIVCTGRATKKIDEFRDLDKEYIAVFRAGATTPSFDLETEVDALFPYEHIDEELVRNALVRFLGEQKQLPPVYSAKLIDGRRSYEYARKGVARDPEPVTVHFRELELLSVNLPEIRVRIVCSKGTYIRSVARDLGLALGSGCYLSGLVRSAIGTYRVENAMDIEKFENLIEQLKQK